MFRLIQSYRWKLRGFCFMFSQYGLSVHLEETDKKYLTICDLFTYYAGSMHSELLEYVKMEERAPVLIKYVCQKKDSDVVLDIQKHISQLFSKTANFRFSVVIENIEKYRFVPMVKRIQFRNESVEVDYLEELIRNHSELEAILVESELIGEVDPNSKIFEFTYLAIQATRPCTYYLHHFKGKVAAFIEEPKEPAKWFIEKWMRKEYSENIRHVLITLPKGQRYDDSIFDNVDPKLWDLETMPKEYPYDEADGYYLSARPTLFRCDEYTFYIEREVDGKVATLKFYSEFLIFSVWEERPYGL